MPLPSGYREVLVTDAQIAERWENTFARLGVDAEVVETTGDDVKRGEWQIGASERDFTRAQGLIEAVAAGRVQLLGGPVLRSVGFRALAVVAVLAAIALGVLLFVFARAK
jgi:hypothetical protein